MASDIGNLTLEGGWRYCCIDKGVFRSYLASHGHNYSTLAESLGLTRERVRQFANGAYLDDSYMDRIATLLYPNADERKKFAASDAGFQRVWARRRPKVVKRWLETGRKRPQMEHLTTTELAEFLGYGDYQSKSQLISNWVTNAGLPLHKKTDDGASIFAWDEVEAWLLGFLNGSE